MDYRLKYSSILPPYTATARAQVSIPHAGGLHYDLLPESSPVGLAGQTLLAGFTGASVGEADPLIKASLALLQGFSPQQLEGPEQKSTTGTTYRSVIAAPAASASAHVLHCTWVSSRFIAPLPSIITPSVT